MSAENHNWIITTVIAIVTGIGGFLSNTLFRKKELDQKGFELLFNSLQTEVKRLQLKINVLEERIEELTNENIELRNRISR